MSKSKFVAISIIGLLLLSLTINLTCAQIYDSKTTELIFDSNGNCTVYELSFGITYIVQGTPGTTGRVTASIWTGNPQPLADIPDDVSLTYFVAFAFDMSASDFIQAQISINYNNNDVTNLHQPYSIYKYSPDSDSYDQLYTIVDTTAKTMTVTLTSIDDPLLAIGGKTSEVTGIPMTSWIIIIVSVIVIIVLALFMVIRWRKI